MFHTKALSPSIGLLSSIFFRLARSEPTVLSSTTVIIPEFIAAQAWLP